MAGESQYDEMKAAVMEVVGGHFRPEFINRIDETVVFHPLGQDEIKQIAKIQLEYLNSRLAERDLSIEFSEAALSKIADAGFDPVYGARPLKRAIQAEIENPLAQSILSGEFLPGSTIQVDVEGDALSYSAS
jgi:ATP-dependent Clp protease ATP-binding subunit ClpB